MEPATPYVHGWHIDAICEHLEAVTRHEIRNLIINIPPRHMKSLAVSVFWPMWVWASAPATRWLFASYAESLAIRDSLKCRRLIQSPWYQEHFGDVFKLAGDQNQKTRFENDKTGYRVAVGVGGSATGEGGDFIVVDDPIKAADADSDAMRDAANAWWSETMSTRGNDPRTVGKVVIMQRLHQNDLTGYLLENMEHGGAQYVHLCLPAEYEPRPYNGPLTWRDPRGQIGELLWPERFDAESLASLKRELGSERAIAGQLQQRPAPAGGAIFLEAWWIDRNRYDASDARHHNRSVGRWLSIDTAMKDKETSDYSAFAVLELTPEYQLQVRSVTHERLLFPELIRRVEGLATQLNRDGKLRGVVIEDKVSGTSAFQTLAAVAPAWLRPLLIAFQPSGAKEQRWRQASVWCEKGMVILPEPGAAAAWLFDFEAELFTVPAATHDDMADAFSQGIIYLENLLTAGYQSIVRRAIGNQ